MIGAIIDVLSGGLFKTVENVIHDLATQKIGEAEAKARIEASWADATAKAYASFGDLVGKSPILQRYIAAAGISQIAVLIWYQIGVPLLVYYGLGPWPSAGATVDWAYAIVAGTTGVGLVERFRRR